jgi:hypothetical protein
MEMAKSGDAYCETEAVNALSNLALSEVRRCRLPLSYPHWKRLELSA